MKRTVRLNQLIKEELSKIILKEVDFQEGTILTLTKVDTSPDLVSSKVYFSVMPEGKTEDASRSLNSEIYEIQRLLNRKLKIRKVPKINFIYDKGAGKAEKIEEILEKIKED